MAMHTFASDRIRQFCAMRVCVHVPVCAGTETKEGLDASCRVEGGTKFALRSYCKCGGAVQVC